MVSHRGHCTAVKDLEAKISPFIDFVNSTLAEPFRWTYNGEPLAA